MFVVITIIVCTEPLMTGTVLSSLCGFPHLVLTTACDVSFLSPFDRLMQRGHTRSYSLLVVESEFKLSQRQFHSRALTCNYILC